MREVNLRFLRLFRYFKNNFGVLPFTLVFTMVRKEFDWIEA